MVSSDIVIGQTTFTGTASSEVTVVRSKETLPAAPATSTTTTAANIPLQTGKQLRQAEVQGEIIPISDEQLIRAIERSVKALQGAQTSLEFSVHDKTNQIMVKVLDKDSGEIIREIPPEKTMDFVARLWELAGILVDERR